ncbi:retrotransposon protein, putative, Ty1-copia subclass [Puccinia sorghi]|uniref:Retrotransposon protein, putative, Ty1-copia subclass n=1 Tax=Puccinia sorghi TaxID=27349 RepID=A0A0L6VDA0_9BASI|nr:retrotransposon protein, putative, Ty1-copia subclass [Puccinia sorghi]
MAVNMYWLLWKITQDTIEIKEKTAQSLVPLTFWDEDAQYASILINHLPSKALQWNSPMNLLEDNRSLIEPRRDLTCTIPFGLKVQVYQGSDTVPVSEKRTYSFLGYEPFSDSALFLDNQSQRIFMSRSYLFSESNFQYNKPDTTKFWILKCCKSFICTLHRARGSVGVEICSMQTDTQRL